MALKIDAKPMVMSMTNNSKDKAAQLGNFLKAANSKGLHGPAIVSYFTEVNKVSRNKEMLSPKAADRFDKLPDLIDEEVCGNPELKKESEQFLANLKKLYPKTIEKRLSLASQGAVTADKVEPKSRFKKFMVFINQFMKED